MSAQTIYLLTCLGDITMSFEGSHLQPADVETVFDHFCDPDAIRARYENAGDSDVEVIDNGPDGDEWVIRSSRKVTVDLPGFARKVLQPTNTMTQTDRWSAPDDGGGRDGTFEIDVAGAPIEVSGTMRLAPEGDGRTRQTVRGDLSVKVPLIGGRIAKWAQGDSQERLDQEMAHTAASLTD